MCRLGFILPGTPPRSGSSGGCPKNGRFLDGQASRIRSRPLRSAGRGQPGRAVTVRLRRWHCRRELPVRGCGRPPRTTVPSSQIQKTRRESRDEQNDVQTVFNFKSRHLHSAPDNNCGASGSDSRSNSGVCRANGPAIESRKTWPAPRSKNTKSESVSTLMHRRFTRDPHHDRSGGGPSPNQHNPLHVTSPSPYWRKWISSFGGLHNE